MGPCTTSGAMETGHWFDGDLYNGRIVRIAKTFVLKGLIPVPHRGGRRAHWDIEVSRR
jgi:hypothetical protein